MKKIFQTTLLVLLMVTYAVSGHSQIGYQICLLNTATGEPRANETVNVTVRLTNSEGGIIYTGNQSATTNDFGVLSLTIGDKDTFKDVDFSKLPFFIEVSANGVMIGKSQVVNVPVAEVAKRIAPMDKNQIVGTWEYQYHYVDKNYTDAWSYSFHANGTGSYHRSTTFSSGYGNHDEGSFTYEIEGNTIYLMGKYIKDRCQILRYYDGRLYGNHVFTR